MNSWLKLGRYRLALVAAVIVGAGLIYILLAQGQKTEVTWITEPLSRGEIKVTINASGTLQPLRSVEVGSEQSGTIKSVLVDVNDRVKAGQIMARLDDAQLKDAVTRSHASFVSAEANVLVAKATLEENTANLKRLQQVFELSGGKVPSSSEMDSAQATLARAKANLAVAKAAVTQATANQQSDQTKLQKSVIRSPINGLVLTRKIEEGQTVAASLSTPTLFSIAEDLQKMELLVNIDEADVSAVAVDQPVYFTVSAYPNRRFPAKIILVAMGSSITDNVVTYQAKLAVDNPDLLLRPGMTANAYITTAERNGVFTVPNAALRVNVTSKNLGAPSSFMSQLIPRGPRRAEPKKVVESITGGSEQTLWTLVEGVPKPITVRVGITNGRMTEVVGDDLKEGVNIITSQARVNLPK